MKKIIRRKITIKTATLTVIKRGAGEKGNAPGWETSVCPVCQTQLFQPAVQTVKEISETAGLDQGGQDFQKV